MIPRTRLLWLLPLGYLALQIGISGFHGYGYFIDELYYIACSKRPALGYVDHPPLAPLLLLLSRRILGDSIPAIRFLPALTGSLTVWLAGLTARKLGGGTTAQSIAMVSVIIAPVFLALFGIFTVNAFEILLGTAMSWVLVTLLQTGDGRWWIPFGALAGLGLLNKHTFVLLGAGLIAGLAMTPARNHLRDRRFWLGGLLALVLFSPNLIWQIRHDWVSLEFYRSATLLKNVSTSPIGVILGQLFPAHPAALPVWLAGLWYCFFHEEGRRYRPLGWCFVTVLGVLILTGSSRPDRIAALYPFLFAAGGVALEQRFARRGGAWLRPALFALLILGGLVLAPLSIPLLPPDAMARYAATLDVTPQIERGKASHVPQWFADRFGWEEMVDKVAEVYSRLPEADRASTLLVADNYGKAGALELFGPARGLPRVISTHNNYHLWGPGDTSARVVIAVGSDREDLEQVFTDVEQAATLGCSYCYYDGEPIWVARGLKIDIQQSWPMFREFI